MASSTNGEAVYTAYLDKSKRTSASILGWDPQSLREDLRKFGWTGGDVEDAITYWSSLPRVPPPGTFGTSAPPPSTQLGVNAGIIEFANALRAAVVENDILSLPPNVYFFNWSQWGSKLYVQKAYTDLANLILNEKTRERFLISGNPGIGKTCFLLYFLKLLLDLNKTVIFQRHTMENWYMFTPDGEVVCGRKTELPGHVLDDPNTWYLIDTDKPGQWRCHLVMVASPYKEHYKEYAKHQVLTLYMPICMFEELLLLRDTIRPNTSDDEVKELYSRWGGICRYVLEFTGPLHQADQASLQKAIATANLDNIIKYVGEAAAAEDASHKLLHMVVTEDYMDYHIQMASSYVAQCVVEEIAKQKRDELITFLKASDVGDDRTATLRGNLFEGFAHQQLQRGGRFKMRNLETQEVEYIEVEPKQWCFFHNIRDIAGIKPTHYLKPFSKRFCAIDALMAKPACLLQITLSPTHPESADGLREIIHVLRKIYPTSDKIPLIFVVPDAIFNTFQEQPYRTPKMDTSTTNDNNSSTTITSTEIDTELGKLKRLDLADLYTNIQQYVLAMPLLTSQERPDVLPVIQVRQLPELSTNNSDICGEITARGNVCENNKAICPYHSIIAKTQKALKKRKG